MNLNDRESLQSNTTWKSIFRKFCVWRVFSFYLWIHSWFCWADDVFFAKRKWRSNFMHVGQRRRWMVSSRWVYLFPYQTINRITAHQFLLSDCVCVCVLVALFRFAVEPIRVCMWIRSKMNRIVNSLIVRVAGIYTTWIVKQNKFKQNACR